MRVCFSYTSRYRILFSLLVLSAILVSLLLNNRSAFSLSYGVISELILTKKPDKIAEQNLTSVITLGIRETNSAIYRSRYSSSAQPTSAGSGNKSTAQETNATYDDRNQYLVTRVRKFCESDKDVDIYGGYVYNFGLPTYVWMATDKHKLFYCAIPKSSSTTWKNYLMEDTGNKWKGDLHTAATRLGVQWVAKRMNKTKEYKQFLEEYRPANRLLIVRNPWARLVSAYKDKIVRSKWNLGHLCVAANHYPRRTNVTFDIFVDCIAKSNRQQMWNSHIHPYTSLCAICHMDYNIIAKMEELEQADSFIISRLNFTRNIKYIPPAKGKYTNTYSNYYENVTQFQIERLKEIYRTDIELFEYPDSPYN
ncbi:carbohydrate sulfotransferase 11-like [Watersipora subatra]|uniref:carbohydrate sulfotransferase 11-like n=1 Tax=Watersipora subatra TaxID=2589382 RepID=UPI00355C08C5